MAANQPTLARRSDLLADLRIIVLGTWAYLMQLVRSWRLTGKLVDPNDDQHDP
jgi:hypothetical protein